MAQHRTKKDKVNAQIHRIEQTKLYSLSDLSSSTGNQVASPATTSPKISQSFAVNMKTVKSDLMRTAISLTIILTLLGVGYHFLH